MASNKGGKKNGSKGGKSGKGKGRGSSNGKGSDRARSSSSSSSENGKGEATEGRFQSPKNTGPGADPRGDRRPTAAGLDLTHGRYRDEVVDTGDPTVDKFVVRRTFLSSKTEFEVEVPKAGVAGIKPGMPRHERDQLIKDAAQTALNLRTQQLSTELDNSDLGGKSIAQPIGGGTYNPENKYAPKPSPGEPGAGSDRNAQPLAGAGNDVATAASVDARESRKGESAPTTTGAPITDAAIAGTPNDRSESAGTSRSASEVAKASS